MRGPVREWMARRWAWYCSARLYLLHTTPPCSSLFGQKRFPPGVPRIFTLATKIDQVIYLQIRARFRVLLAARHWFRLVTDLMGLPCTLCWGDGVYRLRSGSDGYCSSHFPPFLLPRCSCSTVLFSSSVVFPWILFPVEIRLGILNVASSLCLVVLCSCR